MVLKVEPFVSLEGCSEGAGLSSGAKLSPRTVCTDESDRRLASEISESVVETDRTDAARPCCTLISRSARASARVGAATTSDVALVAVASETCRLLVKAEIKDGRAGLLDGPSGDGLDTFALVADRSASCTAEV